MIYYITLWMHFSRTPWNCDSTIVLQTQSRQYFLVIFHRGFCRKCFICSQLVRWWVSGKIFCSPGCPASGRGRSFWKNEPTVEFLYSVHFQVDSERLCLSQRKCKVLEFWTECVSLCTPHDRRSPLRLHFSQVWVKPCQIWAYWILICMTSPFSHSFHIWYPIWAQWCYRVLLSGWWPLDMTWKFKWIKNKVEFCNFYFFQK